MSEKEPQSSRFVSSLKSVAHAFGVSYDSVIEWRDERECPFLRLRPYDLDAIGLWLDDYSKRLIDDNLELRTKKLEAEVRTLEAKGQIFSRDKAFWLAVIALGVTVSREVREWIDAKGDVESVASDAQGKHLDRRSGIATILDYGMIVTQLGDVVLHSPRDQFDSNLPVMQVMGNRADLTIPIRVITCLRAIPEVEYIVFRFSNFSDTHCARLPPLNKLHFADFSQTAVTKRGLELLTGRVDLTTLSLAATPTITDDALNVLSTMRSLRELDLTDTRVTQQGIEWLKGRLIQCSIYSDTI